LGRISLYRSFHKRLVRRLTLRQVRSCHKRFVRRLTLRQVRDGPENVALVRCFLRCMDLTVRDGQLGSDGEPLDSICCFADASGLGF
jgi:hypothetical protein